MAHNLLKPITACFGKPVAENPTQIMIEAAYEQLGLHWRYITLEVDPTDLGAAVAGARAMGFMGFNCTIPHKVAVINGVPPLNITPPTTTSTSKMAIVTVRVRDPAPLGADTEHSRKCALWGHIC